MKRVLMATWMLAVASMGLAAVAEAVQTDDKPFIYVSTSPSRLDLGMASSPGFFNVPKALTLNVDSNCLHGPIMISANSFSRRAGGTIPPDRIFVRSSATHGFEPMDRPVAVSSTTAGSHKIVLDLQVLTGFNDMAGQYRGTFTVTVVPPV